MWITIKKLWIFFVFSTKKHTTINNFFLIKNVEKKCGKNYSFIEI